MKTIQTTPFNDQRPGTSGLRKKTRLFMQPDGNLCLYDANGRNPSCSETTLGHRGAYLSVDDDGHIVVREGSVVLWSRPKASS